MIGKWSITIPELSGKRKRNAYIYLPDECRNDPEARYPVLYMFDGHNVFYDEDATYGKCWGMREYMEKTRLPMIIVAVECNHGKNNARLKEYSPYTFSRERFGRIQGRGDRYMQWLVNEFKPMIDAEYPTMPERENTFIAGSSMGGLMSLYAVLAYNDTFSRAACLSPSIWTSPKKLRALVREAEIEPDTVIYMDYGANEMGNHDDMLRFYSLMIKELMDRRIHLTSRIIPGGEHCEACWEEQIPFFMNTLTYKGFNNKPAEGQKDTEK